jgi:hypothetical protein
VGQADLGGITGSHGGHLRTAPHAHPWQVQRVFLQPRLQQMPCGAVTVGAVQHRRVRGQARDLAKQAHVHPEPPAAVDRPFRTALDHRHLDPQPGQGERGRQPDQAAADHQASQRLRFGD